MEYSARITNMKRGPYGESVPTLSLILPISLHPLCDYAPSRQSATRESNTRWNKKGGGAGKCTEGTSGERRKIATTSRKWQEEMSGKA